MSDGLVLSCFIFCLGLIGLFFLFAIPRIFAEKPRLDIGIAGLILALGGVICLDSLKRFQALAAVVLGLDVRLNPVQRQALVGGLVFADNGGSVLDGVVREMFVELGKLSVFPGGNVSGAGGKCLGDSDGTFSVIDDVIFFYGDNLLFIFECCFSRGG